MLGGAVPGAVVEHGDDAVVGSVVAHGADVVAVAGKKNVVSHALARLQSKHVNDPPLKSVSGGGARHCGHLNFITMTSGSRPKRRQTPGEAPPHPAA